MAEHIKINVGSAIPDLEKSAGTVYRKRPQPYELSPYAGSCHPRGDLPLHRQDHSEDGGRFILAALEHTPPELYADIVRNGIYLAGGGALLRGLAKRFTDKFRIEFKIAEDPLHAVAKGTGVALKNINRFSFLIR